MAAIGTDTHLQGGREIRDDDTACRAIDAGMAKVYGDRIYWRDGYDRRDLPVIEDLILDEAEQDRMARKNGGA